MQTYYNKKREFQEDEKVNRKIN